MKLFYIGSLRCSREDFTVKNKRGRLLQCSWFHPCDEEDAHFTRPVVIYCHCNSGSRRDAEEAIFTLLPQGIPVVCFDFEGSGISEGNWVTLGAHEVRE